MTDTEIENCQGDSRGLKKNQTADKLLNSLPKERQILCEIRSLAANTDKSFSYIVVSCWSHYCVLCTSVQITALGTAHAATFYLVLLPWDWNFYLFLAVIFSLRINIIMESDGKYIQGMWTKKMLMSFMKTILLITL